MGKMMKHGLSLLLALVSACSAPAPAPSPTPSPALTPPFTPTPSPTPTFTPTPSPTPTFTPTPTPSPTPAVPQTAEVSAALANVRQGPGTVYPVTGQVKGGTRLEVRARNERGDWIKVCCVGGREGWVSASLLSIPGEIALIPVTTEIPPTPTPGPTPTPVPSPSPAPAALICPQGMECGERFYEPLQKTVRYYRGWGYEIVDASDQWDVIIHRDVYGLVAHEFWGDRLYKTYPSGIRWTIIDRLGREGCPDSFGGPPLYAYAPIILNQFRSGDWWDCYHFWLGNNYGDGEGGWIALSCSWGGVYYDPWECFIAIVYPGPHITDAAISGMVREPHLFLVDWRHPDFTLYPILQHLGRPRREGDQWRWDDPFMEIVPAR